MKNPFVRKKRKPVSGLLLAGVGMGLALSMLARTLAALRVRFTGQVVIITGGSRGLGLEMARHLAAEGARLAILARNEPDLEVAREELLRVTDIIAIPCDVSVRSELESAVRKVQEQYGRIDMLINNAGIIQVGPVDHMRLEDYENAMAVHFYGPLYAMLAVIPIMRRQGGGRIINISSIGGKVAVPHLAPYVASKFALSGLSDAFRAELAQDGITVTTITPGLMRTGSFYHGNFKGQNEKEFSWFSLMSSNPLTTISSRRAARQVLHAARLGQSERTLTFQARLLELMDELAPGFTAWVAKQANRIMPGPAGDLGNELRTGFESRSKVAPSWATRMGDQAAEKNNQFVAEKMP